MKIAAVISKSLWRIYKRNHHPEKIRLYKYDAFTTKETMGYKRKRSYVSAARETTKKEG